MTGWNPDARDPWPAERYLREPERSSWWLVAVGLALVVAFIVIGDL